MTPAAMETSVRQVGLAPSLFARAGGWGCWVYRAGGRIGLVCSLSLGCAQFRNAQSDSSAQTQQIIQRVLAAEEKGDLQTAESILRQAVMRHPQNAEIRWELAKLLLERGSIDQAILHLEQLVEQRPDNELCCLKLATALYEQRNFTAAAPFVTLALSYNPNSTEALVLKGQLEERTGQLDRALETYHRALLNNPAAVDAVLRIASIQLRQGKPEQAAPLLRCAQECSHVSASQKREIHWLLGTAYAQQERWPETVAELSEHGPMEQLKPDELYQLAYARYRAGDSAGAMQDAARALTLLPGHPSASRLYSQLTPGRALPVGSGAQQLIPVEYLHPLSANGETEKLKTAN